MWKNGDIQDMWAVANQTHLTFNMVRWGGVVRQGQGLAHCWLPG